MHRSDEFQNNQGKPMPERVHLEGPGWSLREARGESAAAAVKPWRSVAIAIGGEIWRGKLKMGRRVERQYGWVIKVVVVAVVGVAAERTRRDESATQPPPAPPCRAGDARRDGGGLVISTDHAIYDTRVRIGRWGFMDAIGPVRLWFGLERKSMAFYMSGPRVVHL